MLRPNTKHPKLRQALALGLLALALSSVPATANLVMVSGQHLVLTDAEQEIIDENPALQDLGVTSSELLRQALDMIAAALAAEQTGRGGLEGLEREDVQTLGRNPVLLQVWQSSPEASADLLELIRTAAGSGKSQK